MGADDDEKHMQGHKQEFAHDNHDDWETQPPYTRPDEATEKRENFEKKVQGSCHCGRVQYWLNSDKPLASKYCHCIDCKKIHGTPLNSTLHVQRLMIFRCSFPMGGYLQKDRPLL